MNGTWHGFLQRVLWDEHSVVLMQLVGLINGVDLLRVKEEHSKVGVEVVGELDIRRVDEDLVALEDTPWSLVYNDELITSP